MLRGKVALVTGSTQGIGLAILTALSKSGADVVMHGLGDREANLAKVAELKAMAGPHTRVEYNDTDLLRPAAIREMIQGIHQEMGSLDILVNNAGIQHVAPVHEFPEDKWDAIIGVILSSTFHTIRSSLPKMLERGWGRVINTGSMHALVASPYKSAYNAAKHGVAGLTKTVALEVAQKGVTCNAICPGYVLTDLVRNQLEDTARARGIPKERVVSDVLLADQPTKEFVKAEDIGQLAVHLCGPNSSCFTGACISIDGGWTAR